MATEDSDSGNGRISNYQLLRDLQTDVKQQGQTLAGLVERITAWVEIGQQTQQQLQGLGTRIESTDRELAHVRGRTDILETRPIAMGPEAQSELRTQVRENKSDIAKSREHHHDLIDKWQPLLFSKDECAEIRSYLAIAKRRQLEDVLTEEQRVDLIKVREWATPEKQKAVDQVVASHGAAGRRWFRRMEIGVGVAIIIGALFTGTDLFLRLHGG